MRQNKLHGFTCVDQDWLRLMIFKNFADQEWTWTEKFHSPLISNGSPFNQIWASDRT